MRSLFWLAKEETAHHTKFSSLLKLGKSLGCSYLSELEVGKNTKYTFHRMIDEFFVIISGCVEKVCKVSANPVVGILSQLMLPI